MDPIFRGPVRSARPAAPRTTARRRVTGPRVTRLRLLGLLGASLLLVVSSSAAPVTSVSDDGQLTVTEDTDAPSRFLFGSSTVPLPAMPDWESDSTRAIGGMRFADVDDDGDLDLALGCYQQTGFPPVNEFENLIHFNLGSALETSASWVAAVERHTGDCQTADVNGDGYADLYFANGGQSLQASTLYLGGPSGPSTTPSWNGSGGVWTVGGALADVDGDGNLDLVQANQGNSIVPFRPAQVFYGDGTTFELTPTWVSADSVISNTAAVADLDGDSELTVVAYSFAADGVRRIFTLPQAALASIDRVEVVPGPTPRFTVDRAAGRVHFASPPANGASVEVDYVHALTPDLAFARWVNFPTAVYRNDGGTISLTPTWDTGDPSATDRGAAFSDVDDDGDLDLGLGNSGDPTTWWENDGGALTAPVWAADAGLFFGTQEIAWGDVDGDGDEDLATIEFSNGHLRVFLNDGGTLETIPSWVYDFSSSASSLAWGDVNGDGFLDLAAGTARGPATVFLNTGPPTAAPEVSRGFAERIAASPNPSAGRTRLGGLDPSGGDVEIFDARGARVAMLTRPAGDADVRWNGRDGAGRPVSAGVYFARQQAAEGIRTGRIVRVK